MLAIKVEDVSKVYKLYNEPIDRLKEALHPLRKKYHNDFFALKDVSFEVKKGETIGIIGRNGAGKSTLLKILTGVLTPTDGKYSVNGKISSLLELGVGFNPELSGLENVYFYGTLLGFTKREIDEKLDTILEFANIGEFIYQAVKTYSSGMQVRLAFSVAINVDPDVLIVDEALAVGDFKFQQKCYRKFREFQKKGKTIILVTHDTGTVINYCNRAIWLDEGSIMKIGDPNYICENYIVHFSSNSLMPDENEEIEQVADNSFSDNDVRFDPVDSCSSFGDGGARIKGVAFYSKNSGDKITVFKGGEMVTLYLKIEINRDIPDPIIGFVLKDNYGNQILGLNTYIMGIHMRKFIGGENVIVSFDFNFPFLKNGGYSISPAIAEGTQENHIQHHWVHDAYVLEIVNSVDASRMGWYLLIEDAKVNILKS